MHARKQARTVWGSRTFFTLSIPQRRQCTSVNNRLRRGYICVEFSGKLRGTNLHQFRQTRQTPKGLGDLRLNLLSQELYKFNCRDHLLAN